MKSSTEKFNEFLNRIQKSNNTLRRRSQEVRFSSIQYKSLVKSAEFSENLQCNNSDFWLIFFDSYSNYLSTCTYKIDPTIN